MVKKKIVGVIENVKLSGKKTVSVLALMDSGAFLTSMDTKLAKRAGFGPPHRTTTVKNPSLHEKIKRPVVEGVIEIAGRKFVAEINLQDRSHMNFPLIIGRNILCGNFIIDPEKNFDLLKRKK
ncbi:MAG: ATP-dependent zinc protease [Candidatus Aenigmarchaeota archaeon]|nr:ATP-dependent zinc protease [Candidatus Aenigmarchaeota archaeon]